MSAGAGFRSTSSRVRSRPRRSTSRTSGSASPPPSSSRAASRETACSRSWSAPPPQCPPFCQRPLTHLLSHHPHTRARSLSWNKLLPGGGVALAEGLKGNSALQSLQYATRARARAREGLLLRLRPLTRLFSLCFHPALSRRLEGNNIGAEGASALAAVLKETKIAELKCAWRRPSVCLLSCQRPLSTS